MENMQVILLMFHLLPRASRLQIVESTAKLLLAVIGNSQKPMDLLAVSRPPSPILHHSPALVGLFAVAGTAVWLQTESLAATN